MSLTILIPTETKQGETRVSATPETVKHIKKLGIKVIVESGAGENSFISDNEYKKAGAEIQKNTKASYKSADIILAVNPPTKHTKTKKHQADMLKQGSVWISFLIPNNELYTIRRWKKNKITSFSMNLIPRISRAQKMDALTSQTNIAGYKAVILAASRLSKVFPLMMTAAGTIQPAKVVILGAGVAGLQAIATAKRLGANVEVSDIRPAVKEQVESLGAKFIEVPFQENIEDKQGYAKQVSQEFLKKQAEEVTKRLTQADIVITTALIPGKKAPILINEKQVASMKQGSVIVDLAAEQGGNCSLTQPGKTIVKNGVTIVGTLNLAATVPKHATEMYAKNIFNLLLTIIKDGKIEINTEDEIIAAALVTHKGKIIKK